MNIGAMLALTATGLTGTFLLATWVGMGGHQRDAANPSRLPNAIVFSHASLASASFVLWLFYVVLQTSALAWTAAAVVVVVIALGVGMFFRWLPQPHHPVATPTAEQELSVAAVAIHGVLATATAVLVVLAIVRI